MSLFDKAKEAITSSIPLDKIPEIKRVNDLDEFKVGIPAIVIQTYNNQEIENRLELIDIKEIKPNKYQGRDIAGDIYSPILNHKTKEIKLITQKNNIKIIKKNIHSNGDLKKEWFIYKPD